MKSDEIPGTDESDKISGMTEAKFQAWTELVGECIQAVSEACGALGNLAFTPGLWDIFFVFRRVALGFRLSSKCENRLWEWLSWRIAWHLPAWALLRLPAEWFLLPGPTPNVLDVEGSNSGVCQIGDEEIHDDAYFHAMELQRKCPDEETG